MGFREVGSLIAGAVGVAPPKDNYSFVAQAAIKKGAAIKFRADGKVNKAVNVDADTVAIALEAAAADTDEIRGQFVVPGQILKCPMTKKDGTAAAATDIHSDIKVGRTDLEMNDDGTGADVETDPGTVTGPLLLISMDTDKMEALVVFTSGALWNTKDST